MRAVVVGRGRDATGVPLPDGGPLPVPPAVAAAEGRVLTAFMTHLGALVVDEWCDPLVAEVGALALEMRAATARQAKAETRMVTAYLWGAAEMARRSGARTERERRQWGARDMLAELATALHLPETTLARRLARLTRLQALPRLAAAHERGAVSAWHLDAVLDVFGAVTDPAVLTGADEFLAERAERMTAPQLRAAARGWRDRHVPRTDEQRRRNLASRRVDITPADEDLCWLTALIPAAQALAIDARLYQIAATVQGTDERGREEIRADALVDLLLTPGAMPHVSGEPAPRTGSPTLPTPSTEAGAPPDRWFDDGSGLLQGLAHDGDAPIHGGTPGPGDARIISGRPGPDDARLNGGTPGPGEAPIDGGALLEDIGPGPVDAPIGTDVPEASATCGLPAWLAGVRADVVLTVPVLTLLGHSDEPAELEGFGPIDLDTARMLAANAPSFVRVLTHPETGAVLSVGRDRYRIPEDLRRVVQIRDVTCRFPGCRRPARRCDLDHVKAWVADRGATEDANLECLCRKHHRLKHEMNWTPTLEPDGRVRWHTPLGLTYWTEPGGAWPPRPAPPPECPAEKVPVAVLSTIPDEPPF